MQHAHDTALTAIWDPEERSGGPLSPGRAFLILLALLIAAFGIFRLTGPADTPAPSTQTPPPTIPKNEPSQPSQTLTRAEAISTFQDLHALLVKAYKNKDVGLLPKYLTPNSPLRTVGTSEIRELRENQIIVDPGLTTRRLTLLNKSEKEAVIRQVVYQHPKFTSKSGEDLTVGSPKIVRIDWTMRRVNEKWKIFDSKAISARPARAGDRS